MIHTCLDCAFENNDICQLARRQIDPGGQICQSFKSKADIQNCELCGQRMINGIFFQTPTETKLICPDCSKKSGTCALCKEGSKCEFETNPSTLPKQVMQQVRRGPAIINTTVRNPERVELTCKNCVCWNKEENYCLKENGICGEYNICFG